MSHCLNVFEQLANRMAFFSSLKIDSFAETLLLISRRKALFDRLNYSFLFDSCASELSDRLCNSAQALEDFDEGFHALLHPRDFSHKSLRFLLENPGFNSSSCVKPFGQMIDVMERRQKISKGEKEGLLSIVKLVETHRGKVLTPSEESLLINVLKA